MVSVDRSVPRHARQVREGGDIGDGSDIDEGRPSCDRKRGHGKALDWRVGGYGGAAEMEERSTRPADHMGMRQRRRLPEIARTRRTVWRSSRCASAVWPVRRSSLCRHQEAAVARSTRKTPVCMGMPFIRNGRPEPGPDPSEGPQRPHPSVTKPEEHFHFSWTKPHETPQPPPNCTVLVRRDQNFHRAPSARPVAAPSSRDSPNRSIGPATANFFIKRADALASPPM